MMYYVLDTGIKTYKLRLNTRNIVELEKKLGGNPLIIFDNVSEDGFSGLPTVGQMITVLHYSLQQFNHGISMNDTYDIFDEWLANGNEWTEFFNIIVEIYKVSGIIKEAEDNEKN